MTMVTTRGSHCKSVARNYTGMGEVRRGGEDPPTRIFSGRKLREEHSVEKDKNNGKIERTRLRWRTI